MPKFLASLLAWSLLALCGSALADDHLLRLETRPGVRVGLWLMERPGAAATVVLLPGGAGGFALRDGAPQSRNFLVRTRDRFASAGLNVVIFGLPSDQTDMHTAYRMGADHVEDLRKVVERARTQFAKPVWLVGTSRGTVSAAAAAIALDPQSLAGVVLTSSVTDARNPGALQTLSLASIRVPVLVMHHRRDACRACDPREAPRIFAGLSNAPVKKLLLVDGGSGPEGDPCEAMHWHGYVGMEDEAVGLITAWIRNPTP